MELTQENLDKLQAELAAAQEEVTKLSTIKAEVVAQRDEVKKEASELKTKVLTFEETLGKTTAELEEARKQAAQAENISAMYAASVKTQALRSALEAEGVIAVETAMKLVSLQEIAVDDAFGINKDTVTAAVAKLKETDAVLFRQKGDSTVDAKDVPKPKRASEGEPKAGFAEELKNCKTAGEVEALLKKFGKTT